MAVDGPAGCGDDLRLNLTEECSVAGDLPLDVPLPEERTLNEPPVWRLGEWWRYRITDRFEGEVAEATRVVAGVEGDNYLVGMPADEFSSGFMVMHVPGFGQVARSDLSFEVHDCPFQFLRFPLHEDLTWEGEFECQDFTVVDVAVTSPTTADLTMWGNGNANMTLTYDAAVGEVTRFDIAGYALIEIIDHGYDFEGIVTVPHQHDVIFIHARFGPVFGSLGPDPKTPTDIVPVDSTYDRVSFILLAGDFLPLVAPGAPQPANMGYYDLKATAPDGETFQLTVTPATSQKGLVIEAYTHLFPGGDWRFDHVAGGAGITLAEGIAYHVYDVDLPAGRILPSTGEHPHGDPSSPSPLSDGMARLALGSPWEELVGTAPRA